MTTAASPFTDDDSLPPPLVSAAPRLRHPRATLLAAAGLGVCAEVLFDGPALGLSYPLFMGLLLAALVGLGGREGWQRAGPNRWLLVPLGFFSTMVFVRANGLLTALNVLASGFLLLLVAHFWAAGRVQRLGLGGYPLVALFSAAHTLVLPATVLRQEVDLSAARQQVPRMMPLLRGGLLALPVLLVFTVLLSSADAVFARAVDRLLALNPFELLADSTTRILFSGVVGLGTLGLLTHALRRHRAGELGDTEAPAGQPRLGLTESLTLVGTVDALFLCFATIQLAFLFGEWRLPHEGLTYAEYARRGFFELLAVSLLTLGLIVALARWTRLETAAQGNLFRVGCTAMIGLVLVILTSAIKRMALYESAYGYTHLRLFTHVFMVVLGGVLVWRAVTLWWRPERFALGAFLGALGYLAAMNLLNPDALIARKNLERAAEGSDVDTLYIRLKLSADAAPVVASYVAAHPEAPGTLWLKEYLELHGASSAPGGWPAYHWARARAARLRPW
jgi:energy-converting hydrogenase Eha subunit C